MAYPPSTRSSTPPRQQLPLPHPFALPQQQQQQQQQQQVYPAQPHRLPPGYSVAPNVPAPVAVGALTTSISSKPLQLYAVPSAPDSAHHSRILGHGSIVPGLHACATLPPLLVRFRLAGLADLLVANGRRPLDCLHSFSSISSVKPFTSSYPCHHLCPCARSLSYPLPLARSTLRLQRSWTACMTPSQANCHRSLLHRPPSPRHATSHSMT